MAFNISNLDETNITITDGWRTWEIPKFRIYITVSEPFCYLYWTDTEKPGNGKTRRLVMDYNDVLFGVYAPSSAAEVRTLLDALIIKAWTDIWANFANYVPYTGATNNVDLGIHGLTADYMAFSQSPIVGPGNAQIGYNGATSALAYDFDSTNVRCNIGQQMYALVHNAEAVTITKGQAVYLYGASGNKASVKLAYNTSDATSAKTFGLAAEDITSNQNGLVITQGVLDGVNTGAYSPGDTLYLGATAGSMTATKPYAPNHLVYVGIVEKANAGNGQIYVRVQNGYELDEIHDVDLITTPPIAGDVLTYDGSLWVAQAPASGSGTVTSIATTSPITGGTITTSGTIGINNAAADGSTKGAAAFTASDFNDNGSGVISIDYTNGQAASGSNKGFLTSADWTTFNSKFTLPALTSGSVLFSNGTTIAQDNANLFWDDTNNRLGIGTNTISDPLHIKGTGSGTIGRTWSRVENTQLDSAAGTKFVNGNGRFAAFQYSASGYIGGEFFAVYTENDYPLVFATNGASTGGTSHIAFSPGSNERMRITNGGNVLVGTTTDAGFKLDINGTTRSQGALTVGAGITSNGNIVSTFNQNAVSRIEISNGISGTASSAQINCTSTNGALSMGKYSSATTAYKTVLSNDAFIYTSNAGHLTLLNDVSTGTIKFTAGGSSTVHWTINSNGNLEANNAINMVFGTTTGTKIGTATSQKIGFWNATPIVQPTTAVAAATFAAVAGGSTIDTNDTFDGYTVGQVVKALRNLGILA